MVHPHNVGSDDFAWEGNHMKIQSVAELASLVAKDSALADRIRVDPVLALESVAAPLQEDKVIYRIVVGALGAAVILGMAGALILSLFGKAIPDILTALGSAAVGALAGLLAPAPGAK